MIMDATTSLTRCVFVNFFTFFLDYYDFRNEGHIIILLLPLTEKNRILNGYSNCLCILLRNEFNFWNVHGIKNTSGLLQSK